MTEPEVTAASRALAALPVEWVSPAFQASILKRASLSAVHRKVAGQVEAATTAAAQAVAALAADPSDAALASLVTTQQALAAITSAAAVLPVVSLDLDAARQAVAAAGTALAQSAPRAPVALDYGQEMDAWRQTGPSRDDAPPLATDADRAALIGWEDADAAVRQWQASAAQIRAMDLSTNDPLSILDSAKSYLERATAITADVEAADVATKQANAGRRAAKLNWSAS